MQPGCPRPQPHLLLARHRPSQSRVIPNDSDGALIQLRTSMPPKEPRQATRGTGHPVPNRVPSQSRALGVGGSGAKCIKGLELGRVLDRANFRRR
jgi:hypothetical protein